MTDRRYYITTPIYYVNDKPHIGHAYTTVACDVLARFKRLDGFDVMFLTGTDEHGQKVAKSAAAAGITPQELCDRNSQMFRDLATAMKISNDDFIRTTEPRHRASVQALWDRLVASGNVYLDSYTGWYSVRDEAYYAEDELRTGEDGKHYAIASGAPVEWVEEPSYFFRLSAWGDKLLAFYEANPDFIGPDSRRNEVISFVRQGLKDLSVSRTTFDWGVLVPGDGKHVMYVWLDALTNYITALGYPGTDGRFARFWPADLHMVGKDIIRFHAVFWPAFLWAAGLEAPKRVYAHGWWTIEGQKMSKSLGNVIDPHHLIATYGLDQFRYFVLREMPFGNDGDFARQRLIDRLNAELANGFGNLGHRTLSFIQKNAEAQVPQPGILSADDQTLLAAADSLLGQMRTALDTQAFHVALQAWVDVVQAANRYIDVQAPWTLRKTDTARMLTVLWVLAEVLRELALTIQPFAPDAAANLLDQLAVSPASRDFRCLGEAGRLVPGTALPPPAAIFPRLEAPAA